MRTDHKENDRARGFLIYNAIVEDVYFRDCPVQLEDPYLFLTFCLVDSIRKNEQNILCERIKKQSIIQSWHVYYVSLTFALRLNLKTNLHGMQRQVWLWLQFHRINHLFMQSVYNSNWVHSCCNSCRKLTGRP